VEVSGALLKVNATFAVAIDKDVKDVVLLGNVHQFVGGLAKAFEPWQISHPVQEREPHLAVFAIGNTANEFFAFVGIVSQAIGRGLEVVDKFIGSIANIEPDFRILVGNERNFRPLIVGNEGFVGVQLIRSSFITRAGVKESSACHPQFIEGGDLQSFACVTARTQW
jgi:hypothetical protein